MFELDRVPDKEQAVLHLYRLYNLHPVIHENLRPEKPPKPFPRACVGEDGEAGENGTQSTPRKRRTRAKAKVEEDAEGTTPILSLPRKLIIMSACTCRGHGHRNRG